MCVHASICVCVCPRVYSTKWPTKHIGLAVLEDGNFSTQLLLGGCTLQMALTHCLLSCTIKAPKVDVETHLHQSFDQIPIFISDFFFPSIRPYPQSVLYVVLPSVRFCKVLVQLMGNLATPHCRLVSVTLNPIHSEPHRASLAGGPVCGRQVKDGMHL